MNGTTLASTATLPISAGLDWTLVHVADFDGDLKADLLWRHTSGKVGLWRLDGATILSTAVIGNVPVDWTIVGVGNFDGLSGLDILWRHTTGEVAVWLMDGTAILNMGTLGTGTVDWNLSRVEDFHWPTITSPNNATLTVGVNGTFVTTMGFPAPAITRGGVTLPSGVTFVDNGNGTATLGGIPDPGTTGTYALNFTASNGIVPMRCKPCSR